MLHVCGFIGHSTLGVSAATSDLSAGMHISLWLKHVLQEEELVGHSISLISEQAVSVSVPVPEAVLTLWALLVAIAFVEKRVVVWIIQVKVDEIKVFLNHFGVDLVLVHHVYVV